MTQTPSGAPPPQRGDGDLVPVISAYGAFRLLMFLLAGWTFFAGFALVTGFTGLSYDGNTASRVAGFQLMILAPIYLLIGWRREEFRLLIWLPYAGQLALIVPGLWQILFDQDVDAPLILLVSIIFFALLLYLWLSSADPTDFFLPDAEDEDDDAEDLDEEEDDEDEDEGPILPPSATEAAAERGRRYRRSP
jgi:hypothetical protein